MPFDLQNKLVIAITSSAVFNMQEADSVFREKGEQAYRKYQKDNIDNPLLQGTAFPFVSRILRLNDIYMKEQPVEVIVLSRNDPDSGRRFFRSCQHYGLRISRGAFTTGKPPYPYVRPFNAALFLSANEIDVKEAISQGLPAGLCLPYSSADDIEDIELRIAFDFDGVIVDDRSEAIYQESHSLDQFHQHEVKHQETPHDAGPLANLFRQISRFQRLEKLQMKKTSNYKPALRTAIVTARDAPANERVITTLNHWEVEIDDLFFLGGIKKSLVLDVLKPHIFFDDQRAHLEAGDRVPSVHIPFGITNKHDALTQKSVLSQPSLVAGTASSAPRPAARPRPPAADPAPGSAA